MVVHRVKPPPVLHFRPSYLLINLERQWRWSGACPPATHIISRLLVWAWYSSSHCSHLGEWTSRQKHAAHLLSFSLSPWNSAFQITKSLKEKHLPSLLLPNAYTQTCTYRYTTLFPNAKLTVSLPPFCPPPENSKFLLKKKKKTQDKKTQRPQGKFAHSVVNTCHQPLATETEAGPWICRWHNTCSFIQQSFTEHYLCSGHRGHNVS